MSELEIATDSMEDCASERMREDDYKFRYQELIKLAGPEWEITLHQPQRTDRLWELMTSSFRVLIGGKLTISIMQVKAMLLPQSIVRVVVEDFKYYQVHECDIIQHEQLLLLKHDPQGRLMLGLTCKRTVGSGGNPVIMATKSGLINSDSIPKMKTNQTAYYEKAVRIHPGLVTGRLLMRIARLYDVEFMPENLVWFYLEELERLSEEEFFSDAVTLGMVNWVLAHKMELGKRE